MKRVQEFFLLSFTINIKKYIYFAVDIGVFLYIFLPFNISIITSVTSVICQTHTHNFQLPSRIYASQTKIQRKVYIVYVFIHIFFYLFIYFLIFRLYFILILVPLITNILLNLSYAVSHIIL